MHRLIEESENSENFKDHFVYFADTHLLFKSVILCTYILHACMHAV